jgi:hypothetical protein
MLEKLLSVLRLLAYIAIIAVGGVRLYTLVRPSAPPSVSAATMAKNLIGKHVELPPTSLPVRSHFLVFAMSTSCVYCAASTPFYHRLVAELAANPKPLRTLPRSTRSLPAAARRARPRFQRT